MAAIVDVATRADGRLTGVTRTRPDVAVERITVEDDP